MEEVLEQKDEYTHTHSEEESLEEKRRETKKGKHHWVVIAHVSKSSPQTLHNLIICKSDELDHK